MSQLNGPFSGDMKTPPSPKENANVIKTDVSQLQKAPDGDVIKPVMLVDTEGLKGSPAALDTPHGTATSTIGKNPFAK